MIAIILISFSIIVSALLLVQIFFGYIKRRWSRLVLLPDLTAYTSRVSFDVGQPIEVHVHTVRPVKASIFRLAEKAEEESWTAELPTTTQSRRYSFWRGFDWVPNLTIDTDELSVGMYFLHLEQSARPEIFFRVPFIIKSSQPIEVAVIASTNTWEAYNDFANLSNYTDRVTPWPLSWLKRLLILLNWQVTIGDRHCAPCVPLPANRPDIASDADLRELSSSPIENASHLIRAEWSILRFLERQGVSYGVYSDHDLAFDSHVTQAKTLVFCAHSEYWSEEMIGRLRAYLESGGHVAFVSGNNMYRKVKQLEHGLMVYDFKTKRAPVSTLLGAAYDAQGYKTYAGYRVADADHWLFSGLGLQPGDLFAGSNADDHIQFGASGYETDKITADSGKVDILAIGQNREGPAYMVLKNVGQGWVLNTGSVASAPWVERDPVLGAVIGNFIKKSLSSSPPALASAS